MDFTRHMIVVSEMEYRVARISDGVRSERRAQRAARRADSRP